jgi:hypothetical protein
MIAHQGGWDEILLVLGPIAVIVGLLMLARKRVEVAEQSKTAAPKTGDPKTGDREQKPATPKLKP